MGFSTWDVAIVFGEIMGEQEGKPVIEEICKVAMTREFTKVFSQVLALNISAYEKQFGEIKVPQIQNDNPVADFEAIAPKK